jgi:hypothetical protein
MNSDCVPGVPSSKPAISISSAAAQAIVVTVQRRMLRRATLGAHVDAAARVPEAAAVRVPVAAHLPSRDGAHGGTPPPSPSAAAANGPPRSAAGAGNHSRLLAAVRRVRARAAELRVTARGVHTAAALPTRAHAPKRQRVTLSPPYPPRLLHPAPRRRRPGPRRPRRPAAAAAAAAVGGRRQLRHPRRDGVRPAPAGLATQHQQRARRQPHRTPTAAAALLGPCFTCDQRSQAPVASSSWASGGTGPGRRGVCNVGRIGRRR